MPPDELDRVLEEDHDEVDDNPPALAAQLALARPGTRRPGQRGPGRSPTKVPVTLRIDRETVEAFRASGSGWQTRMNDTLVAAAKRLKKA